MKIIYCTHYIKFKLLQAADWWSTGVLTCELLAGDTPFNVDEETDCKQKIEQ
jgi:serine/threonine protein kinase